MIRARAAAVVALLSSLFERHLVVGFLFSRNRAAFVLRQKSLPADNNYETNLRESPRSLELPLLDLSSDFLDDWIQPLPSSHLPDTLTSIYLYGMIVRRPAHQMVLDEAIATQRLFGHVAYKPQANSWVGAIGCASEVLMQGLQPPNEGPSDSEPLNAVLCRGSFRFIIKEVVKTIPFPSVLVEKLMDGEPGAENSYMKPNLIELEPAKVSLDDEGEVDQDERDTYATLQAAELSKRLMLAMQDHKEHQLEVQMAEMSPLEQSILKDSNLPSLDSNVQRQAVEEMAAVFDVFQSSLIDLFPLPGERYFAIAFLAAEMANMGNPIRRQCLVMTDPVSRMRIVLAELEHLNGMARARKLANAITDQSDAKQRDLKVGTPTLPPWARQIRKGMKLEYFWNEEWGWCAGEVVEDPVMIVDELILTVHFASDGSTHRLPLTADEKVRWRPAQKGS